LNLLAAVNELGAVAPHAVGGIAEGDTGGIAGVPSIFGEARLLCGGLSGERRQWWAGHRPTPASSSSSDLASRNRGGFLAPPCMQSETESAKAVAKKLSVQLPSCVCSCAERGRQLRGRTEQSDGVRRGPAFNTSGRIPIPPLAAAGGSSYPPPC